MKIKLLILLIMSTAFAHGETGDSIHLGTMDVPFSVSYGTWEIPNGSSKYICFTLAEPTDLQVTVSKFSTDGQKPLMMLFYSYQMHMFCNNYDNNISTENDKTVTIRNVQAGDYKLYIDAKNFAALQMKGTNPDLKNTAVNLGSFGDSFQQVELGCTGSVFDVFHGVGIADGKIAYTFHLDRSMDFKVNHAGNSTVSSSCLYLVDDHQNVLDECCGEVDNVEIRHTNLSEGSYYVLVDCKEVGELYTSISCETNKGIEASYMGNNRIIERTYTDTKGDQWNDKIVYYDDMGRENEIVQKGFSPMRRNVVSLMEYDEYGRLEKKWLPVVTTGNGDYEDPLNLKDLSVQCHDGDTHAYGWTVYEPSQRNETIKEFGAGEDWQKDDHGISKKSIVNDPSMQALDCMRYSVSGGIGNFSIKCMGGYAKGKLLGTEITDEDGHVSYEFKDGFGKTLLKRKKNDNTYADTYYIYDVWGNLQAVLPPMAANEMCVTGKTWDESDDAVSKYAYLYVYDNRYRKIGSKLPGCDWTYTLYDNDDIPVFSQNGEQRLKEEWSFTISDVWGRPCLEGTCSNSLILKASLGNITAIPDGTASNYGYAISGISLVSPNIHKVTFYDNYNFLSNQSLDMEKLDCDLSQGQLFCTVEKSFAKGKLTGSWEAIDGNMDNAIKTAFYYDYRGRSVQILSTNQLGGFDKTFTAYDFTDHNVSQRQVHQYQNNTPLVIDFDNTYDHAGRLLTTTMTVGNNAPVLITCNSYDERGRLASENRNGNEKLQSTYQYNIRNWIENIQGNLFSEQLFYNKNQYGCKTLYGGNISAMDWSTMDVAGKKRGYAFDYDNLGQLKSARYMENSSKYDYYSTSYSYDLMGNVQALSRQGILDDKSYGLIDDLTYSYDGNQVTKITDKINGPHYKDAMHFIDGSDAEIEYKYDKNGCMTQDLNKNICKIEYNLLNLPTKVSFTDGSIVKYSYSADGEKLSVDYDLSLMNVMNGSNGSAQSSSGVKLHRDYCGNFIYEDGVLRMMLFDGGYVTFDKTNDSPQYHFYIKDHLGNNRVVANANGDIEQVNHYYPFGGLMAESKGNVQSYKYNGKELDRIHGLDCYDYGARWMSDGRFSTPDPHAPEYPDVSPYAYCGNNPINAIDVNGEDSYYTHDGKYLFDNLKNTDYIYIVSGYNVISQLTNGTQIVELFDKQSFTDARLSAEAYSNIFTDVLKRNHFDVQRIENGKISVYVLDGNTKGDGPSYESKGSFNNATMYPWSDADVAVTHTTDEKSNITAYVVWSDSDRLNYLSTISNIVSVLGVHELTGHVLMHMKAKDHWKILKMQREYPTWDKTTKVFKELYVKLIEQTPEEYLKH